MLVDGRSGTLHERLAKYNHVIYVANDQPPSILVVAIIEAQSVLFGQKSSENKVAVQDEQVGRPPLL
jgi:hypothetical protein